MIDHPDIIQMENKGYIGTMPRVIAECEYCDHEITKDETAYESKEGIFICDELECKMEHAMKNLEELR